MDDGTAGAMDGALTEAEQELVRAAVAGQEADLKRQSVRASVLRELLLETRPGWALPPVGLRISRAVVQGCLDLDGCTLNKPLMLWHSRFEGGGQKGAILIRDGRLKGLGIYSCTVEGNIVADRAEVENGLFLGGGTITGTLMVRGASIGGALALEGTELGDGKAALLGAGLRVKGPLIVRRARMSGELALPRAHLEAGIYADGLKLRHEGIALNAESARIGGDILLPGAEIIGGVSLLNVRLEGRLSGEGLTIDGVPTALDARGLDVTHGIVLDNARLRGTLLLDGAAIGKAFRAEGIEVDGGEIAIGADVIHVGANWEMPRAKLIGQLRLPGARVEGQLRLTEMRLFGTDIALRGDGAWIRGGCFLSRATVFGLVRFPAAEFGNQFRMRRAIIKVEAGAALLASGTTFRRDVELTDGCEMTGAVILDQVQVMGALDLRGSRLKSAAIVRAGLPAPGGQHGAVEHADEIALSLVDADINRLVMPARAEDRPRGIVDLSRARAGSFEDYADAWPLPLKERARTKAGRDIDHLVLDGFAYEHLSNPAGLPPGGSGANHLKNENRVGLRRITWLEGQTARDVGAYFKPQAWVALAERLTHQGYLDDARTVEIARRRRERRSNSLTSAGRWQNRLLDWFALYGHNPWRTVMWMAVVVVMFAGV